MRLKFTFSFFLFLLLCFSCFPSKKVNKWDKKRGGIFKNKRCEKMNFKPHLLKYTTSPLSMQFHFFLFHPITAYPTYAAH